MGHATTVVGAAAPAREPSPQVPAVRFLSLLAVERPSTAGRQSTTLLLSMVLHTALVAAVAILPLLFYDVMPETGTLKAFFVSPLEVAPAPPPPPPPAPARRAITPKVAPRVEPLAPGAFLAPIDVPEEIEVEQGLDLGVEGGVPGGVEGGVPGGVVGGVVGGLPAEAAPPKVVRIGGMILAPKLVKRVNPVYPELAIASRAGATIILEALVDTRGHVKTVHVVRGHQLFDDAALEAVRQWRYQPLLLNGQPTEFILNVTVVFNLRSPAS